MPGTAFLVRSNRARKIQKVFRGYLARKRTTGLLRAARNRAAAVKKLAGLRRAQLNKSKAQALLRMRKYAPSKYARVVEYRKNFSRLFRR